MSDSAGFGINAARPGSSGIRRVSSGVAFSDRGVVLRLVAVTVFAGALAAGGGTSDAADAWIDAGRLKTVAAVDTDETLSVPGSVLVNPADNGGFGASTVSQGDTSVAVVEDDGHTAVDQEWQGEPCRDCPEGFSQCHVSDGLFNRFIGPACPRWEVQVDALMLWQGNIPSRPILQNGAGFTVLDANQTPPAMSAGPRTALLCNLDCEHTLEGNYFNVGIFPGEAFAPADTYTAVNLPTPVTLPSSPTAYTLLSQARIQSAEMNWRRRSKDSLITWLVGFRWVEWNQVLQFADAATPPLTGATGITGNDLYGGQIGADVSLWNAGGRLQIDGIGKAGVFYNTAYQRTYGIIDVQGTSTLLGPTPAAADQTSFFGEVGATATLKICRWLSWRAGYSVFWLSGVAVPADQWALTSLSPAPGTATINTNGSVLLHGVTTGLEVCW
jgi:hypothetical protein